MDPNPLLPISQEYFCVQTEELDDDLSNYCPISEKVKSQASFVLLSISVILSSLSFTLYNGDTIRSTLEVLISYWPELNVLGMNMIKKDRTDSIRQCFMWL